MNIFFDLDGTLLDCRKRLYTLFQDLVPESALTIDEYWDLKRNKIDHKTILTEQFNYSVDEFKQFEETWLEKIELFDYLQFDTPVCGVHDILDNLSKENDLYVVTSRQSRENAVVQLKNVAMYKYFTNILVTGHEYEKTYLVRTVRYTDNDWYIGDTGHDIITGRELGLKTIAVTYGFLKREVLASYSPEYLLDRLEDIESVLK